MTDDYLPFLWKGKKINNAFNANPEIRIAEPISGCLKVISNLPESARIPPESMAAIPNRLLNRRLKSAATIGIINAPE